MSKINTNKQLKYLQNKNKKRFTNKTYLDFKNDLLNYSREFYSENILDFSETSLGGMFLDFASIVGDSLVYYAEQQFNELDYETATNTNNINKHLRRANIKNNSAYPSSVDVTFSIIVEKDITSSQKSPKPYTNQLPVIKKNTIVLSDDNNIHFVLDEDVDFSSDYTQKVSELNEDGSAYTLLLSKKGSCTSGFVTSETADFTNIDEEGLFLSYKLENNNITKIISVFDSELNEYYEVDYLSQGTIFKKSQQDENNYITVKPAPYRYMLERDYNSGITFLRFGNGEGKGLRNDTYANNADLLIPIKNSDVFGRVDLDPSKLLKTNSLGVSPKGKSVNIIYKFGGGISHNVRKNSIVSFLNEPITVFKNADQTLSTSKMKTIIDSITMTNKTQSVGGAPAPTLENLKQSIPTAMNAQSRIITYDDLIARILTMPSDFGKIEKAVALDNEYSSFSKDLFIVCRNSMGHYINTPDAIKINLSKYINEFRLISDNYNILDVPIFNFGINAVVKVQAEFDIETVLFDIETRIVENVNFYNLQIGEPINVSEISKIINNTDGVVTLHTLKKNLIVNKTEKDEFYDFDNNVTRGYSNNVIDSNIYYADGLLYPPRAGIFEMKYSSQDITIIAN
jgi:hypothetical protein